MAATLRADEPGMTLTAAIAARYALITAAALVLGAAFGTSPG